MAGRCCCDTLRRTGKQHLWGPTVQHGFFTLIEFNNIDLDDTPCPGLLDRLKRRDTSLWSTDKTVQDSIAKRLGWLDAGPFIDVHAARIKDFAEAVKSEGYRHAVLLGMGGSSLAPEVYAALFDAAPQRLALRVADSTCPDEVLAWSRQCTAAETLFIVSSKSGTTAETSALEAYFFEWMGARVKRPGQHFIAITDPGSPLAALAEERGYRDTFLNPVDIGGRFSALSYFGLVPAALSGADPARLRHHLPDATGDPSLGSDACRLGLALGQLAGQGRNKLTLRLAPPLEPLAPWIEQLVDESTGKDGTGIVAVAGEPPLEPESYSSDRCFAVLDFANGNLDEGWTRRLIELGHPLARWRIDSVEQMGAEFLRWEIATAIAGLRLGINPFDEPDVNDSKAKTRALLEQAAPDQGLPPQPPSALRELLDQARPGDYIAILAYLPRTCDHQQRLEAWRERLSRHTGLPGCIGFGPRYLHSSGQLHKGGPDQGLYILLTLNSRQDLPIPGQEHGFKSLFEAQALGDLQVLKHRGRRVVHLAVGGDGMELEELLGSMPQGATENP